MAALNEALLPDLVQLPQLTSTDLDPLLAEEIEVWQHRFAWDFRPSADLLRRFLQIRSLYGCALRVGKEVVGYSYYVCEGRKGLIGDFYVRSEYASTSHEMYLLNAVAQGLMQTPGVRRIESQLMLVRTPPQSGPLPFCRNLVRHDRYFMEIRQEAAVALPPKAPSYRVTFIPWAERYREEMARVVAASYRGHVDSEINDQYRNIPGARQFLSNIVKFPGCGRFSPEASVLALDSSTGRLCGLSLASHVSANSGHVTQLCVLPALRGARLGYELLRRTLSRLADTGCTSMSLTVTCTNVDAIRLYRSIGFEAEVTFPALVWEGF
jgi:ribosomal protein S18 acetylase RimI-like enzyme